MWPISINEIKRLQIELTTFCNADCPSCERRNYTIENDAIYVKPLNNSEISLKNIKEWLPLDKFHSLREIHFCGNVDEPTLHNELISICKYLKDFDVWISTNGGTKNRLFWTELAKLKNVLVIFGIDGLEDTNHLYRQNVKWKKLEDNYTTFIREGGNAAWQFIVFEHNKHQIDICRDLSVREGFKWFNTVYSTRENHEVEAVPKDREKNKCIRCKATYDNNELKESFYIDALGTVWPCCWMATNYQSNVVAKQIGYRFGHYLSHNLKYDSLENIVQGDMFAFLWKNLSKFEVCNTHCLHNISDTITWHGM